MTDDSENSLWLNGPLSSLCPKITTQAGRARPDYHPPSRGQNDLFKNLNK